MPITPPPVPEDLLARSQGLLGDADGQGDSTSAAPQPEEGAFAVGGPLFNATLVAILMAISFAAVALPDRSETVESTAPNPIAFVEARDTPVVEQAPAPTTTEAPPEALNDDEVSELLADLLGRLDDQAQNGPDIAAPSTDGVVTPSATPSEEELVEVVYRTEKVEVPVEVPITVPRRPECSDYANRSLAQIAFDADRTGLAHFDGDGDGQACEQLVDPNPTPDRVSCDDFTEWAEAQAAFEADRLSLLHLDGDGDGRACEQLPGTPIEGPELPPAAQVLSVTAVRQQQGVFGLHTREAPWWMGEVDYLSRLIGKAPNNLLFFSNWSVPFPAEQVRTAWGRGMTPQVAWEPIIPGADSQPTLRDIADGEWDSYIDEWASAAAAHGQPIVLRLAAEMNGNWYTWSEGVNGNEQGDYVDMWRHVHDRFTAAGADNVVWLWSVNRSDNLSSDIATYWPGEEYTDWVGLSGYWRGYQGAAEPTFDAVYNNTLSELRALTAKPILLAEIGAGTSIDADRVQWMDTLFDGMESNPDIIGFVYFNDIKSGGDWRVQFSQAMVDSFADGVSDDRWKSGALPIGMKIGDRLNVPAHSDPDNDDLAPDDPPPATEPEDEPAAP